MTFARWPVLFGLILPVLLMVWQWWPKAARLALPYDHGPTRRGVWWSVLLDLAGSLPPLVLAVAVCILAGPQQYGEPKDKRILTNIQICVDVSGSMTAPWGEGDRYDAAMKAVNEFVGYRQGDAFGLTFWGSNFVHWAPLTQDPSAVTCSVPFMHPNRAYQVGGGTMAAKMLRGTIPEVIKRQEGERMIVVVTDGDAFDLRASVDELSKELRDNNIATFSIIVGGDAIQSEWQMIADATGGGAFEAEDPTALAQIFKKIDAMKPVKMEKTLADAADYFEPWCVAGLILLGLTLVCDFGLRATPW